MGLSNALSTLVVLYSVYGAQSAVFTIQNNCIFTIWPATLTGRGRAVLTGFELPPKAIRTLTVTPPWSGRVWARHNCSKNGTFICESGDCASRQILCNNAGGIPPATLAEFTLGGADHKDVFDISLVDGFNLPVAVRPNRGNCRGPRCAADVNRACPAELALKGKGGKVVGCKSACTALNQPQYCCTGAYGTPEKCGPTNYSKIFKGLCPEAYSFAYDDATSTFTCPTGSGYLITFWPADFRDGIGSA